MKLLFSRILLITALLFSACNQDSGSGEGNSESSNSANNTGGSDAGQQLPHAGTTNDSLVPAAGGNAQGGNAGSQANQSGTQQGTATAKGRTADGRYPVVIEGFMKNSKSETAIIDRMIIGSIEPLQSQMINAEGSFSLDATIPYAEVFQLRLPQGVIHIPVHPNDHLFFTLDPDHIHDFKVEGSREPILLREMYRILDRSNERLDKVEALREDYRKNNMDKYRRLEDTIGIHYKRLRKMRNDDLKKFIDKADTSFSALLASLKLDPELDIEYLEKMDKKLGRVYPNSPYYKGLREKVVAYAPVARGRVAPEILSLTPKGNQFRLSSLKGKYVLIDFWASWCAPCKKEIPKLQEIYSKYKNKNFEILSVSLDNNRNAWINGMAQFNMPWQHVSDLEGFGSSAAQIYLVDAIPATVLLDPQGRIIERNFTADELQKILQKTIF